MSNTSLRERIFGFVPLCCFLFVLGTAVAMALYPGGIKTDHSTRGYSFLVNFFSDLGRRTAINGVPNHTGASIFQYALTLVGLGLMLFFAAFATLFWEGLWMRVAALWGAFLGMMSGFCFIGVAAFPVDFDGKMHAAFVIWAFRLFFCAVLPFAFLIFAQRRYPKLGAWLFIAFALGLGAYIILLTSGPRSSTPYGLFVQVVGQKLIVYSSILCVGWQAILARRFLRKTSSVE